MSKVLKYSFSIEFLWNSKNGFSKKGVPKISFCINPSSRRDFDSVGVEILNALFLSSDELNDISSLNKVIDAILNVIQGRRDHTIVGNETESLEIKKDLSRIIDGLEMYGANPKDGENSWNITAPLNLQYIPTQEILEILQNWKNFLNANDSIILISEFS